MLDPPRVFSSVACFYGTVEVGVTLAGWTAVVERLFRLVAPGGWWFLAILGETKSYALRDRHLPCAFLRRDDVVSVMRSLPIDAARLRIEESRLVGQEAEGLNKLFLVAVPRRASAR